MVKHDGFVSNAIQLWRQIHGQQAMQCCKSCLVELIGSVDILRPVLGQNDFCEVELCTTEGLIGP